MHIKPFSALRPPPDQAAAIAAPPYDVVDTAEARLIAEGNPKCFLRIARAELELPENTDPYSGAVYQRAADNMALFKSNGWLAPAPTPALYVYRLEKDSHAQSGVVTCCHVKDYDENRIKRHEKTRQYTEDDRARHVDETNANTGPVFLTYRDEARIDELVQAVQQNKPLYDFTAVDGVRHTVWEVRETGGLQEAFLAVPSLYVADGHHRAASAARVARLRRDRNPRHTGDEEYNWFLTVLFPAGQLRILPYNRVVMDLNGLDVSAFLREVESRFHVTKTDDPRPATRRHVCMYVNGAWHALSWDADGSDDPVANLDVSVLQDRLLNPVLGIGDPRSDPRIAFVGGIRGIGALEKRVDSGKAAVAFSMHPVTINQLLDVSDADRIMPPKSTWFEPKLRSGLLVHELE